MSVLLRRLRPVLLAFAGAAVLGSGGGVAAEAFDEPCYELGKQWLYEAKDMLLCDRTGRRININKICKMHLSSSSSGRLIIDNSKEDGPTDSKKQAGHFPELCLPGQRSYALQAPFLCTCVMHKGRHRWECVAPEGGTGRAFDSVSGGRAKRSAPSEAAQQQMQLPLQQHSASASAAPAVPLITLEAEPADGRNDSRSLAGGDAATHLQSTTVGMAAHGRAAIGKFPQAPTTTASSSSPPVAAGEVHDEPHLGHEGGHNGTVLGRQAASFRPNIIIDFCDEFGYVHTISSTMRDCACDKDVIATKQFSFKDNDIYHGSSLFAAYECLPGTYSVRCEVCYTDTRTCQPTPCP